MEKTYLPQIKELEKIVINTGIGRLSVKPNFQEKILPEVIKELALITGQKPAYRPVRQSSAGFKVRQGTIVGLKVTLRGRRMAEFFHKLIAVVLPRLRDFRGLAASNVDAHGNLSIGIREQTVFPEISAEHTSLDFGLQVTVVPRSQHLQKALALYRTLGVPLKKNESHG